MTSEERTEEHNNTVTAVSTHDGRLSLRGSWPASILLAVILALSSLAFAGCNEDPIVMPPEPGNGNDVIPTAPQPTETVPTPDQTPAPTVGSGPEIPTPTPRPEPRSLSGTEVAAGEDFSLAIGLDGAVWAWGSNNYGQVGIGADSLREPYPQQLQDLGSVSTLDAGSWHALAVRDGSAWAWGRNHRGQLGIGHTDDQDEPVSVVGLVGVVAVAGGSAHSLALLDNGTVWAWGANDLGQLGIGTREDSLTPVIVSGLPIITAIATRGNHSLALDWDGTVWAWGQNVVGQLGDGTLTGSAEPVEVVDLDHVTAIAAGLQSSFALRSNGTVWQWGAIPAGLREESPASTRSPRPLLLDDPDLTNIVAVADRLALRGDGTVWTWDSVPTDSIFDGSYEVVPAGSLEDRVDRVAPPDIGRTMVSSGRHTLIIDMDGTLWAWGQGGDGQLGDGGRNSRPFAIDVRLPQE